MKKVLKLKFKNSDGKNVVLTVRYPREDLKKEDVKAAMQKLVDSKAFSKDEVYPYAEVVSASYYTTQSDDIFAEDGKAESEPVEAANTANAE